MQTDIETLRDTFTIGHEVFETSRTEANEVRDFYHNRQWTSDQVAVLENRGQPQETYNIIKKFSRILLGYYATVKNTILVKPVHFDDIITGTLLNDLVTQTLRVNNFNSVGDKIKLDGFLSGLMVSYIGIQDTGETDQFNRPIREITIDHIPETEIILDPLSTKDDYSDARFIHRFKWLSEERFVNLFGKDKLKEAHENHNFTEAREAEFTRQFGTSSFVGRFKIFDNYLVVHTIIEDDEGKRWSIFWHDLIELKRTELTFREVKSPYRVQRVHTADRAEYYGIFREVVETQKAINQAVVKIQLLVNTNKAFVENGAVDNIATFTDAFNRVNGVIPVTSLKGIKLENMSGEVQQQYVIIDKALERVQSVLGINDSFLGLAFASDSGRKVKLQQNATILSLHYLTERIEQFYKFLGQDIVNLMKQYYTAEQIVRITDDIVGDRWIAINQPMEIPTGQLDPETGEPLTEFIFEQLLDPATNKPLVDANGDFVIAPIPEGDTELSFGKFDVEVESTAFNDEDEKTQLMIETILSGNIGNLLSQVNPAGFFQISSLTLRTLKTRYSPEVAKILEDTAKLMGNSLPFLDTKQTSNPSSQQAKSSELKLPQNTNESTSDNEDF